MSKNREDACPHADQCRACDYWFCADDEMTKWCATCEDEDKLCHRCIGLFGIYKLQYHCKSCWSVRGIKNKVDKRYYCITCDQRCGRIRSILEMPIDYKVCKLAGKCLNCERIAERKLFYPPPLNDIKKETKEETKEETKTEELEIHLSNGPLPSCSTSDSKTLVYEKKKCPVCSKSEKEPTIPLLCCDTMICVTCAMKIIYKTTPSTCPFCTGNPHDAVKKLVVHEQKESPNEVHIESVLWSSLLNGMSIEIDGHTLGMEIMKKCSDRVSIDLSREVEGGFMDYKLLYRDRHLDLYKTMYENGWSRGIAKMHLIDTRTPSAPSSFKKSV